MKYSSVLKDSLWRRITGLIDENEDYNKTTSIVKQNVPLLLSDPVVLLLQIMLSLPCSITKGISSKNNS